MAGLMGSRMGVIVFLAVLVAAAAELDEEVELSVPGYMGGAAEDFNASSIHVGPEWEEFTCDDTGRPFYVNSRTKDSVWEAPEAAMVKKWDNVSGHFFVWDTATGATFWEGEEEVEAEWREGTTPEGDVYWYNPYTDESVWHNPTLTASEVGAMVRAEEERAGLVEEDQWEEALDGDGNKYFYNPATDQSLWHLPGEEVYSGGMMGGKESEWQVAMSEEGRKFYYNTLTGKAQWYSPDDRTETMVVWLVWGSFGLAVVSIIRQFILNGGNFKPLTAWEKKKLEWREKRSERRRVKTTQRRYYMPGTKQGTNLQDAGRKGSPCAGSAVRGCRG